MLGSGGFYSAKVIPAGFRSKVYPYANETSDPLGVGKTMGSVMDQVDYSLRFRISLQNRYEHDMEWRSFPW